MTTSHISSSLGFGPLALLADSFPKAALLFIDLWWQPVGISRSCTATTSLLQNKVQKPDNGETDPLFSAYWELVEQKAWFAPPHVSNSNPSRHGNDIW